MYSVDCCPKGLVIGKQGENEAEKVVIDFSAWASEHGAGTISARLRRPKNSAAYPVVLTTEGTTATWTVSATDTQHAGSGSLQLVYIVGDVVAKSVIWPVRVLPSLEEGEAPEPYESWLDTLEGLAADTQENARDAAASAADASASAADAAQSAQDAAESAASITGLTAVAQTLPEGSEASASFDSATDTLTLGIPRGDTGATGPAGPAGPKGDTGADGFSPTIAVTEIAGGHKVSVTDADGAQTFDVMDGVSPVLDDEVTEDSANGVKSSGIYDAIVNLLPVDTASGAIASFPDGADNVPVKSLVVQIEPIQEGSGDPSPDNVRPISGHTGVKVEKRGKNLFDKTAITPNSWIVVDTTTIEAAQNYFVTDYIPVNVGKPITSTRRGASRSVYYDKTKNPITYFTWSGGTLNPQYDGYIRVTETNVNLDTLQVELGSTATDYEPYQGEIIPVSWESEAGTVYGGTLDVVSGKLTSRMAMVDLGTLNYGYNATCKAFSAYKSDIKAHGMCISSQYKYGDGVGAPDMTCCLGYAGWFVNNIVIKDSRYTNASDFKSAVSGVQLCYELAEPIEYTLTPQEVKTYLGQNNIWNDVGDTEVMYRADIQKFIEKKVSG